MLILWKHLQALHTWQGEAYKLLWPKKPEFVRTAVRHGATIIPVAAVGGDDFIQVLQVKIALFTASSLAIHDLMSWKEVTQ
jgi:1-acyl-sn-glycerol-3-phosphate acyltransferase